MQRRRAATVAVLFGAVNQFRLVHHIGNVFKDHSGQLHPHADIHLIVQQLQPQVLALAYDLHLLQARCKHLGTENNLRILTNIYEGLMDKVTQPPNAVVKLNFVPPQRTDFCAVPARPVGKKGASMSDRYDVVILGCGEAGIFAAYELAHLHPVAH